MRAAAWVMIVALGVCTAPSHVAGQIQLALPLEGFYHPGQYMPVLVITGERTGLVEIEGDALTVITPPAQSRVIVPVLILQGAKRQLAWRSAVAPGASPLLLQPLREDQRLVAATSAGAAGAVFAEQSVVTVRLDPASPLPGPASAWDTLDAIVLDTWPGGLDPQRVPQLLAGGTLIATPNPPPASTLPWQPHRSLYVLRPSMAGPLSARFDERVYLPTQGWQPAHDPAMRQLILLAATVLALLSMGLVLWSSRLSVAALAGLVAVALVAGEMYRRHQPAAAQRAMEVMVPSAVHPAPPQLDRWRWHKALRGTIVSMDVADLTYPIFASASHLRSGSPVLYCARDGSPQRLEWTLAEDASLATLTRAPAPAQSAAGEAGNLPPAMMEMVRRVYVSRDVRIGTSGAHWVVLERRE